MGLTDVNLSSSSGAPWNIRAIVRGTVASDRLKFRGDLLPKGCKVGASACDWPKVQPFEKVVGDGVFETHGKGATIEMSVPFSTQKALPMVANIVSQGD